MTAAIHRETADAPCRTCGAPAGQSCPSRIPHVSRIQAAALQPLEQQVCSRCLEPARALVGRICPDCATTQPTLDEPERYP